MKIISLTVNPYGGMMPAPPMPGPAISTKPNYSVGLVTQFEDEKEALAFTSFIVESVKAFADGER